MNKKFNVHDMLKDVDSADIENCEIETIKLENCESGDCFLIEPDTETVLVVGFRDFIAAIVDKACDRCAENFASMMLEVGEEGTVSDLLDLMGKMTASMSDLVCLMGKTVSALESS